MKESIDRRIEQFFVFSFSFGNLGASAHAKAGVVSNYQVVSDVEEKLSQFEVIHADRATKASPPLAQCFLP